MDNIENPSEPKIEMTAYERYIQANNLFDCKHYEQAAECYEKFLQYKAGAIDVKLSVCDKLASIYRYLGDKDGENEYLLNAFQYDLPRAEICCRLGFNFLDNNQLDMAIFWYNLALNLEKPQATSVFFEIACWTWLPNFQLGVCYFRLGDFKKAYEYNEKAFRLDPDNVSILKNKMLIEEQLRKQHGLFIKDRNLTKSLKIVQVAPMAIPVPPDHYGGIERVVYDLTEELVKRGHEVYLYALSGSSSSATIIPYSDKVITSDDIAGFVAETLPANINLIHDHTHASVIDKQKLPIPVVSTIHDSRANTAQNPIYLCEKALKTIGRSRGHYIYNGIDIDEYDFSEKKEDYLLFLGVLNWHKGINYAIDVCERTKQKLIIAGPIFHPDYFDKEVKPRLIHNPNIQYVGEVGGKIRRDLLKYAKCMLFPTSWEEPFGLVMVEAMASGTPVLALANGAVPEVLSGFPELICKSIDEMVDKVMNLEFPAPYLLREYVMNNFTVSIMTDNYLKMYNLLINESAQTKNI